MGAGGGWARMRPPMRSAHGLRAAKAMSSRSHVGSATQSASVKAMCGWDAARRPALRAAAGEPCLARPPRSFPPLVPPREARAVAREQARRAIPGAVLDDDDLEPVA